MRQYPEIPKLQKASMRLLFSYLAIILAPAVAIVVIYITMQDALLAIQKEKAQNLSKEAVVTFNKEMEQLDNVAKYIGSDTRLKAYMNMRSDFEPAIRYYMVYELAKSYPDYALLNRFVKNICIFPAEDSYIIQIPQVIPNNARGMSTVDIIRTSESYEDLMNRLHEWGTNGLIFDKSGEEEGSFLIVQRFTYDGAGKEDGLVAIELDKTQIKNILRTTLGTDEGVAFLVDEEGGILYAYDQRDKSSGVVPDTSAWEEYIEKIGWKNKAVTINKTMMDYNQWSLITIIPKKELLSKIGAGKYAILLLCIFSLLIGIAICLWYWNSRRPVIERFMKFTEKYPEKYMLRDQSTDIWKNFGGVLEHVEDLQITVDKQHQWAKEGILRKLLYGNYDSEDEIKKEMEATGIAFPVDFPCSIVRLEMGNPMNQELILSPEILKEALKEELDRCIPWHYWLVGMGPLNYILVISHGEEKPDGHKMKQLFEKMNYTLYSRIPINIYTGISGLADTPLAISEEYEHVCRICEYAKYYKLRMPLLFEELPRHQHVIFTVELEMQLENTIKGGTQEQLKNLMDQVMENYLKIPGGNYRPMGYNLEVLRCIVLRCLDEESAGEQLERLLDQVRYAKTTSDMESCIFDAWHYFADSRIVSEEQNEETKKRIMERIQQEYPKEDFNLAAIADWLGVSDKKLYRDFKKMFGVSFTSYLEVLRIHYAREYLKEGRAVQDVAAAVGYSSDYSFRRAFKRVVGTAPSDYQKRY